MVPLDERSLRPRWRSRKGGRACRCLSQFKSGTNERTSQITTVYYSPTRLNFALAVPDDATEIVFDENRPYLNLITAGTVDATLDFYRKELAATGWSPLSAADATAQWPNAKLDEKPANGAVAYFIRGTQRPIMLSLQRRDDGKTNAEIKVPPFAQPQTLEADKDVFGLPRPKLIKTSGGTGGSTEHEVHAHVMAEVDTVLAFYRRELAARNWKEETQGAVVKPDEVDAQFHLAGRAGRAQAQSQIRPDHRQPRAAASAEAGRQSRDAGQGRRQATTRSTP